MPKKKFEDIPFPALVSIDTDTPVSVDQVSNILRERQKGASICIRSTQGHTNRGGYFFHVLPRDNDLSKCELYNFEKTLVATLLHYL